MSVHDKNTLNQDMAKGQNPDGTMFVWLYIDMYIYIYRRSDPPIFIRLNYVEFPVLKFYTYIFLTTWTGSSCGPCCSQGAESQVCSCADWCKGDSCGAQTDKGNGHQGLNLALAHEEISYHNGVIS